MVAQVGDGSCGVTRRGSRVLSVFCVAVGSRAKVAVAGREIKGSKFSRRFVSRRYHGSKLPIRDRYETDTRRSQRVALFSVDKTAGQMIPRDEHLVTTTLL